LGTARKRIRREQLKFALRQSIAVFGAGAPVGGASKRGTTANAKAVTPAMPHVGAVTAYARSLSERPVILDASVSDKEAILPKLQSRSRLIFFHELEELVSGHFSQSIVLVVAAGSLRWKRAFGEPRRFRAASRAAFVRPWSQCLFGRSAGDDDNVSSAANQAATSSASTSPMGTRRRFTTGLENWCEIIKMAAAAARTTE